MNKVDENNCIGKLPLSSVKPDWDSHSNLINTIVELEKLKARVLEGTTPPFIFFQLKGIFHKLESLGSGRIEGNRTTLADYVEQVIDAEEGEFVNKNEKLQEIFNIEKAMRFIEDNIATNTPITKAHLFEVHKIVTKNLSATSDKEDGEGSKNPGSFRMIPVKIKGSKFCPPDFIQVNDYVEDLLRFVNDNVDTKGQLLRVAIAHHRFACIHPFDNGNGRVVRLFTYMLLIRYGFQVRDQEIEDERDAERIGRILNPTAIFCVDREKYYEMLSLADSREREDILKWCEYVLVGLLKEIEKIDKLLDYGYLKKAILLPAITDARQHNLISDDEYKILHYVFKKGLEEIKARDIRSILNVRNSVKISRMVRSLKDKKIFFPIEKNGRIYNISLANRYLMRSVVSMLERCGFAPGLSE